MQHKAHTQRGASLVEFIVVGPIAILFTLAILQFGFMYMAKLTLNNAVFMAARAGASENANRGKIEDALEKGLIPFYQNATVTNDLQRLTRALLDAKLDNTTYQALSLGRKAAHLEILSPNDRAFQVYGITENNVRYIPNDNLEYRNHLNLGGSDISIRDANILRIKVTYAYELKIPLMARVVRRVMCGGTTGVSAFGNVSLLDPGVIQNQADCARYYNNGRVPIVSYATVQMQSRPQRSP
jgi:hypothetical protein